MSGDTAGRAWHEAEYDTSLSLCIIACTLTQQGDHIEAAYTYVTVHLCLNNRVHTHNMHHNACSFQLYVTKLLA